jgi:hypothetical protein
VLQFAAVSLDSDVSRTLQNLKSAAQDNMRSSQLDPTYVSNGLQGPDNISPNGWTPNSNDGHPGTIQKTQPETIVEGEWMVDAGE